MMTEYEITQKTEELINLFSTNSLEQIKNFIDKNPTLLKINKSNHGKTILEWACYFNKIDIVKLLIENNINTQVIGELQNPLSIAVEKNYVELLKYLLSLNIYDLNHIDQALEDAIFFNKQESSDILIKMGGDINYNDCSPLRLLCAMEKYQETEYLLKLNCKIPEDLINRNSHFSSFIKSYKESKELNEQLNQDLPHQESIKNQLKI